MRDEEGLLYNFCLALLSGGCKLKMLTKTTLVRGAKKDLGLYIIQVKDVQ